MDEDRQTGPESGWIGWTSATKTKFCMEEAEGDVVSVGKQQLLGHLAT
jgi:hypothetical protein